MPIDIYSKVMLGKAVGERGDLSLGSKMANMYKARFVRQATGCRVFHLEQTRGMVVRRVSWSVTYSLLKMTRRLSAERLDMCIAAEGC